MQTAYSSADHAAYMQPGSAIVSGQGFLRQRGGGVVTCAGSQVFLLPATPFFREAISQMRAGYSLPPMTIPEPDRSILKHFGQCDAQGNFRFTALPAGAYFILTNVQWSVGYNQQGGVLMREIDVPVRGEQTVMLSDSDFVGR